MLGTRQGAKVKKEEMKSSREKATRAIQNLIDLLEEQVKIHDNLEAIGETYKRKHAEILVWERSIERQEELHELQCIFWRNMNDLFFWKSMRG
jgi:NAD dependent epimerase/dehydratase family enzyme